jgi:hypothetical protein
LLPLITSPHSHHQHAKNNSVDHTKGQVFPIQQLNQEGGECGFCRSHSGHAQLCKWWQIINKCIYK